LKAAIAGRFAGDDDPRRDAESGAESGEFECGEVMEDEIAEDDGEVGVVREGEQIGPMPLAGGGP